MTRKQQLRHYNVEKAEEVVAGKNTQKEELVKAVKSLNSILYKFSNSFIMNEQKKGNQHSIVVLIPRW